MIKLVQMFCQFFKIGLFAVGGGLATIPFLTELATTTGWYSLNDLSTMIAVSESTPGAMGVNMATYVGFSQYGVFGAIVVTLGLVTPSICVICIIAKVLDRFKQSQLVQDIFSGLKPAVVAFIASATLEMLVSALFHGTLSLAYFDIRSTLLLAVLFLMSKYYPKAHPIVFIVLAAIMGIVFQL